MRFRFCLLIVLMLPSCASWYGPELDEWRKGRVLLGKSEEDQSSVFDTNGDGVADIERWYRGSQIAYEKLDRDFDGFWDVQGRRLMDGEFKTLHEYPRRKYPVKSHHTFLATAEHPEDVVILARAGR